MTLEYVDRSPGTYAERKLAVSFHVVSESGPMTWHAKAMQTSYLSPPRAGFHGAEETNDAFPFTTTSWYFLDAVDAKLSADTKVVVALAPFGLETQHPDEFVLPLLDLAPGLVVSAAQRYRQSWRPPKRSRSSSRHSSGKRCPKQFPCSVEGCFEGLTMWVFGINGT